MFAPTYHESALGNSVAFATSDTCDIHSPCADEVGSIVVRTGGEAVFVTELVRHGLGTSVPASVRAVVQARIAGLPPGHAALLDAAAVLGVRFRLDLLYRLGVVAK